MKLEKQVRLSSTQRIGLTFEGFNIANRSSVTSRTTASGSTYFVPRGVVQPRRYRLGAVFRF